MQRILVHETADCRTLVWDVTSDEQRHAAFLDLFRYLDSAAMYQDASDPAEQALLSMARRGSGRYAQALLLIRREREGEAFFELPVGAPGQWKKERKRTFRKVPCPEALADPPPLPPGITPIRSGKARQLLVEEKASGDDKGSE